MVRTAEPLVIGRGEDQHELAHRAREEPLNLLSERLTVGTVIHILLNQKNRSVKVDVGPGEIVDDLEIGDFDEALRRHFGCSDTESPLFNIDWWENADRVGFDVRMNHMAIMEPKNFGMILRSCIQNTSNTTGFSMDEQDWRDTVKAFRTRFNQAPEWCRQHGTTFNDEEKQATAMGVAGELVTQQALIYMCSKIKRIRGEDSKHARSVNLVRNGDVRWVKLGKHKVDFDPDEPRNPRFRHCDDPLGRYFETIQEYDACVANSAPRSHFYLFDATTTTRGLREKLGAMDSRLSELYEMFRGRIGRTIKQAHVFHVLLDQVRDTEPEPEVPEGATLVHVPARDFTRKVRDGLMHCGKNFHGMADFMRRLKE